MSLTHLLAATLSVTLYVFALLTSSVDEVLTFEVSVIMVRWWEIEENMSGLSSTRQNSTCAGVPGKRATYSFCLPIAHVYGYLQVRAVVQMFTSRAELLDKGETTAEHAKNRREEADRLDNDKANTNPQCGGLFGGLFKPKAPVLIPVMDEDDNVMRCPHCAWELEGGEDCLGCGWRYRRDEDRPDYSDTDDHSDPDYGSVDDEFGDVEDDDSVWGLYGPYGPRSGYIDDHTAAALASAHNGVALDPFSHLADLLYPDAPTDYDDYDDEEEEDDYDDMDSFIEDDGYPDRYPDEYSHTSENASESDRDTVVDAAPNTARPLPAVVAYDNRVAPRVRIDEDETDAYIRHALREPQQRNDHPGICPSPVFVAPSPSECESSEAGALEWVSSEAGTDETNNLQSHSPRLTQTDDCEASETESSSSPPRPMRPSRNSGLTARNAITIEDSEDEQPVGPMRRGTQRRRARFSPY